MAIRSSLDAAEFDKLFDPAFSGPEPDQTRPGDEGRGRAVAWVKFRKSRPIDGTIRNATVTWPVGRW
ncbi:protein of unknown function [Kyrpidia spormannii]|uniref:Uncharacterized protein n=1 Tax=Kyrpidia spormannii TaxID=2055160 RepID=A0A6F9EIB1_9BACL|nr:protein of unknown function [Kyrpidia spormannii]